MAVERESQEGAQDPHKRIEALEARLSEAEETLRAIRSGEVDAVVVSGPRGEQVFSLVGADSIYRLIVETMKEAAFTVTFDGQVLFCNAQFGKLVKRPMELVVGHPLQEFVGEENRASVSSLLLAAQQKPVKQRLAFQDPSGKTVPAHVSANTLNQPDGVSICIVANDLTELENSTELIQQLRLQQEALRESEARFRSVLENSTDGLYRLNLQAGHYEYVSPAFERMTGYSLSEITAGGAEALMATIHPGDRSAMRQALTRLNESGETRAEYRQKVRNGDYRWISNHMSLTRDVAGQPLYCEGSIRDITTRKDGEEALSRKAAELHQSNKELAYFNKIMVNRELRMIELKKEIDLLCRQFGQPPRYGYGGDGASEPKQDPDR